METVHFVLPQEITPQAYFFSLSVGFVPAPVRLKLKALSSEAQGQILTCKLSHLPPDRHHKLYTLERDARDRH
jgi:hypothetical protein